MYRILLLTAALLALLAAPACIQVESEAAEIPKTEDSGIVDDEAVEEEAVPVEVVALSRASIEAVIHSSASLEAESSVAVHSQTTGLAEQLLVEEGDKVRRNQLLLQLEDDEQRSEVRKATSQLAKQRRELDRYEQLFEDKLISEQDYNESRYQVEQMEITLADAERRLKYTSVRAPISGIVTARMINLGDRIQVSAHLFDIVDFDSLVARVYLPEKRLEDLRIGQHARLRAQALGEQEFAASVNKIAPIVDNRSGTVKVTIAVGAQEGLRPGMYVDVDLITAVHANALLVPKRCLVYDREQVFVFRIDDQDRAERVLLESSLENRDAIEPLEGFVDGDILVTAGQAGLKPGALVRRLEAGEYEMTGSPAGDDTASDDENTARAAR